MNTQDFMLQMLKEYPYCIITQKSAEDYLEFSQTSGSTPTPKECREFLLYTGNWKGYYDTGDKKEALEDGVSIHSRSELPALFERYHVDNESDLCDLLWLYYGVSLKIINDK